MTKEAMIEMEGVVTQELPDTRFRVTLSNCAGWRGKAAFRGRSEGGRSSPVPVLLE